MRARVRGAATSGALVLAMSLAIVVSPPCVGSAAAGAAGAITEFSAGLNSESAPSNIAPGADGNLWFTDEGATKAIGRITPSGTITEFSAGLNPASKPRGITAGPEGNLWFADRGTTPAIGRITPSGVITEFSAGLNSGSKPYKITLGPDGDLWFTDEGTTKAIGQITPSGTITEFSAGLNVGAEPLAIASGSDGNLWFTDEGTTKAVGRITQGGIITEFSEGLNKYSAPWGIAPGSDGNVWFTDVGALRAIGRVTPSGAITEFEEGLNKGSGPGAIAPGADGSLWFTDLGTTPAIGRITPSGAITEFSAGLNAKSAPVNIAPGSDGNMWFADEGTTSAVGQIGTGAPMGLTSPPAVTGNDQAGTAQLCGGAAWATWAYVLQPSAGLFSFDGYRWLLGGSEVATGQSYTPTEADVGDQLACTATVTYPLLGVTIPTASAPITVAPPPPTITAVHQSRRIWRDGSRLAQISRRRAHKQAEKKATPVGTTFSFVANEQVSVTFSFSRHLPGRTVAKQCVARTRKNAKHRGCERLVAAGALSLAGSSGTNTVAFQGRISSAKRLAPGRYTLTITAANSVGAASPPESLSFTIVK